MNKNSKYLFLGLTLLILLISVGSISATDNTTSTTEQISTTDTPDDVVTTSNPKIEDKKIETKKINSKEETKTIKQTTKKENTNKTVKKQTTHIINNTTISQYFNKDNNYTLPSTIADGDTLDIQGNISNNDDKDLSMIINRPVNIISSTKDAYIDFNTTAGSLFGDSPGNSFSIITGADYTNVTGINLHNTQLWISAVNHVTLDNISAVVKDQRVGSGVGQTSIRDGSEYITVKNSYFSTTRNGGSSTFVLAYANYCNIDNCTITAGESSGNLFYFTTYNVNVNMTGKLVNSFNNVTNCKILPQTEGSGISLSLVINGFNNTFINNTVESGGISPQWAGGSSMGWEDPYQSHGYANYTFINNTVDGGIEGIKGSLFINNTVKSKIILQNSTAINNTFKSSTEINSTSHLIGNNLNLVTITNVNASNSTIINNNMSKITVAKSNVTIENNTIMSNEEIVLNVTSENNIIRNNYITSGSLCCDDVVIVDQEKNVFENNTPKRMEFNVTDITYTNFFDETGNVRPNVTNYTKLNLIGIFNNKNFTMNNIKLNINGIDAILNNATIVIDNEAQTTISNITINTENSKAIIINSNNNRLKDLTITHNTPTSTLIINNNLTKLDNIQITKNINTNTNENLDIIRINSDNNTISNLNMTIKSDIFTNNITAITLNNANNNKINLSNINMSVLKANGLIMSNSSNSTLKSNILYLNTTIEANGIIILNNSNNTKLEKNNLEIISLKQANGITISNITTNNLYYDIRNIIININSTKATGFYINSNNHNISYFNVFNKININTIEDVQGIVCIGNTLIFRTINVNSSKSLENNSAITLVDVENLGIKESFIDITGINISPLQVINCKNITCITYNKGLLSATATKPIYLINSSNIKMTKMNINILYSESAVSLVNSSNNEIISNYLIAHNNTIGGNSAVIEDQNSKNNIITNNTPTIYVLNNQTYSQLFDENGVINITCENGSIMTLTSDLYGVNMEFNTSNILLQNYGGFTLYNSTIKFSGEVGGFNGGYSLKYINIKNTNRTAVITNTSVTGYVRFENSNFELNGDIVGFKSYFVNYDSYYNGIELYYSNIVLNGTNTVLSEIVGGSNQSSKQTRFILNNDTISLNGNNSTIFSNSTFGCEQITRSNINVKSKNVLLFNNNASTLTFENNNLTIYGENIIINKDLNYSGTDSIRRNQINITSKNPVSLFNAERGNKNFNIRSNNITVFVETPFNGRIPLINSSGSTITGNYINVTDSLNNSILGNEAVIGKSVSDNTPSSSYHVFTNISSTPLKYNQHTNITIRLEGLYYNNINGNMNITVNNKTYEVNGTEITIPVHIKAMQLPITVNYIDENGVYQSIENYIETLNVSRGDAQIQVTVNSEIYAGQSITLTAVISDKGELIKDGYVAFKLNGVTLKDANGNRIKVRVINGVATLVYTIPSNYAAKDYLLTAVFSNGNYDRVEVNQTVTIIPSNVFIQPTSVYYENGKLMIKADIKDAITNKNVAVRTKVTLKINGKTFIDRMVIENGTITVTQDIKLNDGIKTLTIISGPNKKYNVNEIKVNFMVTNTPVKQSKNATQITTKDNLKAKV